MARDAGLDARPKSARDNESFIESEAGAGLMLDGKCIMIMNVSDTYSVGVGTVLRCLQDNRTSRQLNNCTILELISA